MALLDGPLGSDVIYEDFGDELEFHCVIELPAVRDPAKILALAAVGALDDVEELGGSILGDPVLLLVVAMREEVAQWKTTTMLEPVSMILIVISFQSSMRFATAAHAHDEADNAGDLKCGRLAGILRHSVDPLRSEHGYPVPP